MNATEALAKWDAGEAVWSIEMGGLGPSYEQAIQILIFELVRDAGPFEGEQIPYGWGERAITRANEGVGGFSGAQVGAAKGVAARFLTRGYDETLASVPDDRRILVSKRWAQSPTPAEPVETKR
jgi:hypothetical protein